MKALIATACVLLAGCVAPMPYEGYYTPGSCSGGVCSIPRPVAGHFPAVPPTYKGRQPDPVLWQMCVNPGEHQGSAWCKSKGY